MNFDDILLQYWGYPAFRPLQREIVQAAYDGHDTLALLPTGGGKSICFQVAAMAREGLCIVVTPLIALMKDQVENLKSRRINAAAIFSGMNQHEISTTLDNCKPNHHNHPNQHSECKFLYLSPEQLATERFRSYLTEFNVNLLAVDEAHCISQWGYDFRPSYMRIAEIRELLPKNIPVLALTATATPYVARDIMKKLNFRAPNLLQKSFERKNLTYVVRTTEDKFGEVLKIARAVNGSAIVYVRTRRAAADIANFLQRNRISADYYHGGMETTERSRRQNAWKNGRVRIMCATNAFGMGIDKPDVRWVAHIDVPNSMEEYYQEAGRCGRDEQRAYAVLLYNQTDYENAMHRTNIAFPPIDEIKRIYQALGTYFEIPVNTGGGTTHDFNINEFCERYKFKMLTVFSALKILQSDGYIDFSEEINLPSRAMMVANRDDLYRTQVNNPELDVVIKAMLRACVGIFSQYVNIDAALIARAAGLKNSDVHNALLRLSKMEIISYLPQKKTPVITFTEDRLSERNFSISKKNYDERKYRHLERLRAMLCYAESNSPCRSKQLLAYFGEQGGAACGHCDACTQKNELDISKYDFETTTAAIKTALTAAPCSVDDLLEKIGYKNEHQATTILRWLLDNEQVENKDDMLRWVG
jgi:ATP-dependent DNA helicase RecQ